MLYVESFTFNPFSENSYIVYNDDKHAVIIDPGMFNDYECRTIDHFIVENGLQLQAIINTHTHLDHVFGVQHIKDSYNVPFLIHKEDQVILDNLIESSKRFGLQLDHVPTVDAYLENEYKLGDDIINIFLTPGHSPGSVSFYYPNAQWVISGDVLFNQSIGRTDLPLGDFDVLKSSIQNVLYALPEETTVYSGHGPLTSIRDEKYSNPFVRHQ